MLEGLACWCGIAGALLIALKCGAGFLLFLVSSVSWLLVGVRQNNRSLQAMNLVYTAINLLGISNWLL